MATATFQPTSRERYQAAIGEICKRFGIDNKMAAPRITKVCLNMGVGRAIQDGAILTTVTEHMTLLAGQRAVVTKTKKAVANFRSRKGMKIGCRVTLRGARMWAFLDKMIHIAIPRIRDFRGISPKGFDEAGNYNVGLAEQALFPEVVLEKLEHNQGLHITICFENGEPDRSRAVLQAIGMPFRER